MTRELRRFVGCATPPAAPSARHGRVPTHLRNKTLSEDSTLPPPARPPAQTHIHAHLHLQVEDLGLAGGGGADEVVVQQLQNAAADVLQLLLNLQAAGSRWAEGRRQQQQQQGRVGSARWEGRRNVQTRQ